MLQKKILRTKSFKGKINASRSRLNKVADFLTKKFGSMAFLCINLIWFIAWVVVNLGWVPNLTPFDPFPFGLLTTVVSLEAIMLAIIVLISQNRAAVIDDLREEIDLKMDVISEQELTKLMKMVAILLEKNGVDTSDDKELKRMLKSINVQRIESVLEKEIN